MCHPRADLGQQMRGLVGPAHLPVQKHIGSVTAGLWDIDEGLASVARLYFGVLGGAGRGWPITWAVDLGRASSTT